METAIVLQIILTLFAAATGLTRLLIPYARFIKLPGQAWAIEFKPEHIKLIGALEVSAAAGLILPLMLPSVKMLLPLAAVGIALVMAGAMATHLRRSEYLRMVGNLAWLGLALFVAYEKLIELAV